MADPEISVPIEVPAQTRFSTPGLVDPIEIEVGGAILELPAGSTQETIKKALANFRKSPEFDSLIDKDTGAPARVRTLVGSAREEDRLANLKRFFPDATPHGEDNFVYTDPQTGKLTLYNPEGADLGDLASVAREGAQAAGASLGAAYGVVEGAALGAPAGPPGMIAGAQFRGAMFAGAGTSLGGSLFDASMNLIAGRVDTRSPLQATLDAALDAGGGAVGQRVGELLGEGVKFAIRGSKTGVQRLVEAYRSIGVDPPAGAVTGSRTLGSIEKALEATPGSSSIMQENAEKVLGQTRQAMEKLTLQFGQPRTEAGAGEVVKRAAVEAAERFKFTQEGAYQAAFDLVGEATPVAVKSVSELRRGVEQELSLAPQSLKPALQSALGMLRAIEADAAESGIAFSALRQIRTNVGRDLASPQLTGSSGAQNEALKRIYGALTEDMSAAAKAAGPEAAKKLEVADRFTRQFMNTSAQTLEKIAKFDADEKAFMFVMTSTRDGAQMLARLRRSFSASEWDAVSSTVLSRLGRANPGGQDAAGDVFSVNTFLTNWNRMTPEARETMFGGPRYKELAPELDNLVRVVGSLKEMEKLTNSSNTARNMIAFMTLHTLGGALGLVAAGDTVGAGVGILGTLVAPRVAAKLITSPRFIKWLTTPVTDPNGLSAHVARLGVIVQDEPEIADAITSYVNALRDGPQPGAPASLDSPPKLSPEFALDQ